ncbi:MAG: hypothetical protein K0R38_4780 [Polyangiaceae bacterium]|jgi:hypothetical protein|nr:hypothetical protein [Polyangiaceae bacterium]
MEAFAAINDTSLASVRLTVAAQGPWFADCVFVGDAPDITGRVRLQIGELTLSGTIAPQSDGTHGLQRRCRVVAGAGGWGVLVSPKDYHSDAGVKARTVADDVARAAGEALGTFAPGAERVGVDYLRQAGPASRVLEDAARGAPWWVDYAGVTHVGARPTTNPDPSVYEVLEYDPLTRRLTLAADDLTKLSVGAVLTERLDEPQTIRELEVVVEGGKLRVKAWCGGTASSAGELADLLKAIVARATDEKLFGKYRYRVVSQVEGRLNLQATKKRAGLPDAVAVSMWPGVAGTHAVFDLGAGGNQGIEVLVEFIEGDRTQPVVTHFVGKDTPGFVPRELVLCGGHQPVARQGDTVEVLLPPAVFSGTINGAPATGVLTFPLMKTQGVITTGSPKVKA